MCNPSSLKLAARSRAQDPAHGVTGDEFSERKENPEQEGWSAGELEDTSLPSTHRTLPSKSIASTPPFSQSLLIYVESKCNRV